jgi:hypothetical protein
MLREDSRRMQSLLEMVLLQIKELSQSNVVPVSESKTPSGHLEFGSTESGTSM